MKWEVRTMRSGTSFFNVTVWKKTVLRFWPIWAVGLVFWVLALPAQYRMAVHLYYYEELSVAEIAAVLGKSEGAVKSRLFRARALLRRYLKEDDDVSERL